MRNAMRKTSILARTQQEAERAEGRNLDRSMKRIPTACRELQRENSKNINLILHYDPDFCRQTKMCGTGKLRNVAILFFLAHGS